MIKLMECESYDALKAFVKYCRAAILQSCVGTPEAFHNGGFFEEVNSKYSEAFTSRSKANMTRDETSATQCN